VTIVDLSGLLMLSESRAGRIRRVDRRRIYWVGPLLGTLASVIAFSFLSEKIEEAQLPHLECSDWKLFHEKLDADSGGVRQRLDYKSTAVALFFSGSTSRATNIAILWKHFDNSRHS